MGNQKHGTRIEDNPGKIIESELRMEKVAQEFPEYQSPLPIPGFGPMVSESVMITGAIVLICRQPSYLILTFRYRWNHLVKLR